ncbi:MAG: hypothetical protein KDD65_14180 [Bacteroidetes bacterium]|nr:hypothetical protein [Bacteroidota bacterium]
MKPKLNREWHRANRMPKNPSMDQRIAWHLEHAKNCGCRSMPESVVNAIADRNKKTDT